MSEAAFIKEAVAVLDSVEWNQVFTTKADRDRAEAHYCGDVSFTLSNGWTVVVFNDCDEFDYIERVTAPDGRSWCSRSLIDAGAAYEEWEAHPLASWVPHAPNPRERWGLEP